MPPEVKKPELHLLLSLKERRLRRGEVLCRVGDPGHELFLVYSGSVVVSKPVTGRVEQVLSRLGTAEMLGVSEKTLYNKLNRYGREAKAAAAATGSAEAPPPALTSPVNVDNS